MTNPPVVARLSSADSMIGVGYGFGLFREALGILRRQPDLWSLAALPIVLTAAAFAAAVMLLTTFFGEIHAFATGWLPALAANAWYQWLWIGPAVAILWLVGKALLVALVIAALVAAFMLANLLAAPFLDALALRVEVLETGALPPEGGGGLRAIVRDGAQAVREELRRLVFFAAVWAAVTVAGVLIPGGQLLVPPVLIAFTIFFLPLDYASYTLDRRGMSFARKRAWLSANSAVAAGFGATGFALCAIPVLNFAATPVLVIAGTLLALRLPEPSPSA